MTEKTLIVEPKESFVITTINRPKYNFFSVEVVEELERVLHQYRDDRGVRSMIITAAGDKFFTAGWDIRSRDSFDYRESLHFRQLVEVVETYPKPVILAMNGHAFGGGCELALGCHFRLIDERARIGLVETNVSWIPGGGGTQRLPRLIGQAKALEYLIFGVQVPALEAYQVGLVNKVSPAGQVLADAIDLAGRIGRRSPLATAAVLDCLHRGLDLSLQEGLKVEMENLLNLMKTRDFKEGMDAFFEKRDPVYKGE